MIEITFPDGQIMKGYTTTGNPWERGRFFMTPVDPRCNNVKVFVITPQSGTSGSYSPGVVDSGCSGRGRRDSESRRRTVLRQHRTGAASTPCARLLLLSRYAWSAWVLIGVVLGSAGANAQPPGRPYRIGVLNDSFTPGTPTVEGLKAGIKAAGLEEGRDVRFDVRSTGTEERSVVPLAAALAREHPHVIVAVGERATRAAQAAAPETPVVFLQIPDPVAIGLVTSVPRPGGLVTGVADLHTDLVPKRLELAKELMPTLRRVLLVYDAQDAASAAAARRAQETAPSLKLNVVVRAVRTQEEAVRELKAASARDVLLAPATLNLNITELILNLNLYVVAPAIFPSSLWVQAGGVASYGVDNYAEAVQGARLVAKILRGARPADLPVESVNKIEMAINRKTLKAFGVTIPPALEVRVDRVFEGIGE
jgi:putative ABC transport system substrate-binding protein